MARSLREILFRLRQEAANFRLYAAPPCLPSGFHPPPMALPEGARVAARLKDSAYAVQVEQLARQILQHRFPILGYTIETGPDIEWRKDYVNGPSTPPLYFRRIPYLDFARAGDHKIVWELSRHQHLVLLAQAWLFSGRPEFSDEIVRELGSWIEQNPCQRGIHWASALEVGFRALSWIWTWHFAGGAMPPAFRERFLTALYQHGVHLQHNFSVYFSPNTHLLGEAVALHALGVLFPSFPHAPEWRRLGRATTLAQMEFQVQPDGSHFEQSSYYHVYALDMFLLHHILEPAPYADKLRQMASYLDALMGQARTLVSLGDDDGGRLFFPYGPRDEFGRATLATCAALFPKEDWYWQAGDLAPQAAWWLGEQVFDRTPPAPPPVHHSQLFPAAGVAVMSAGEAQVLMDAGSFGYSSAGHSHCDSLSITARVGTIPVLIDPGTFTYVGDPEWRHWFRSSAAHNTIRVDSADQAVPAGPFRWTEKPSVKVLEWITQAEFDYLDAICVTAFRHRRRVFFRKPGLVFILDQIDGPPGEHVIEQFWHLGDAAMQDRILLAAPKEAVLTEGAEHGWRSPVLGVRLAAPVLRVVRNCALPSVFATTIDLAAEPRPATLSIRADVRGDWYMEWNGPGTITAAFGREKGLLP